ncbi:long-chain-fatty-acid--CoA ligase, putative [Entamoeba histolytica HM-1:IMSS-B]|uniref:Long-chain-fatty-acid--CoA ligase, putative n=6 Tax=Entamoeba histolytica TaxID=5759 RepID=C4M520_ENTH1|nr:long-chain-fatty-acid--CoA ligase, putative [Entamoeba histolytica HM-1:IMSS]EMD44185.1 longchain-fatty-acid-CoA ligase, putative [Entamoeba histolytica KU27]EMH73364.1 long-chain-fatty-acid--CoA ligase, putative [Entamoeba histolytica HM-1:IMSS-B]EMS16316.1 long-chain-fatty-acid--CoA ligase, putative [Entamoeba histolytica HM-3:IMSS]ENY62840.1 long-chain-fatty-acid--CoA ligase, putative [Entamoeba histolytica HM-1:IMSS-A]GAT96495.1 long-chain-fatty-acid--coa ligase putative [Entamoeba hist|eukprot:XP_655072.1 long-chain-fatty-acid--CoA ligase, putative [Entamoeba histolytica HM-1:IMSS]
MSIVGITLLVIVLVSLIILYHFRPNGYDPKLNGCFVGEANSGESRVMRGYGGIDKLVDYNIPGFETIADVVNGMTRRHQNKLIGYRTLIKEVPYKTIKTITNNKEVEKVLYKYQMSDYQYFSDVEFQTLINKLSSGIADAGFKSGDKIAIFCETRYEWMAMLLACCRQGIIIVTVYATLGDESVGVALKETEVKAIVVSKETIQRINKIQVPNDVKLICVDELEEYPKEFKVFKFSELKESAIHSSFTPVKPNDLALIMYTSGTSKDPKGVLVEQKQILMLSVGYQKNIFFDQDVFIAYLPLAHIFELCIEFAVIMHGGTVGYANVRTLTSPGVIDCKSDLCALEPTILIGVPTVFNRVRKAILETVNKSAASKQKIFNACYWIKEKLYVNFNLRTPYLFVPIVKLVDAIAFRPLAISLFGSYLKAIIIGGSALPCELQHFLQCVVPGVDIMQGFGMTELCGACSVMPHGDATLGSIGCLFPMYEAKLRDVPELGYLTSNNPPQGELLFRGLPVSKGYFNRPEESKEAFTEDGWLCTGDIAKFDEQCHIYIIDRKKNIVKQPCGEYISLELVESKYSSLRIVDSICVFADAFHDFVVALILPNKNVIQEISDKPFEEACEDKVVIQEVKKLLKEAESTLTERQRVKHFALLSDDWTPENGMLTAALKLKRQSISTKYQLIIKKLFDEK